MAVHCPLEVKAMLVEAEPRLYFDTPHFAGWPSLLVRMEAIDDATLADRLEAAWRLRAPASFVKGWERRSAPVGQPV